MKMTRNSILLALAVALIPATTPAVNLTFDSNTGLTGAQDGSGTWDTNTATWWNGTADVVFNNNTPDAAFFGAAGGTAGTVTLATNVTPFGITFNAASVGNYTIAGGGFTLGLTNRTVTANVNGTISANIVGTIVTTANSAAQTPIGTVTLSGNNAFTGGLVLGVNAANTTTSARLTSSTAAGTGTISFNGNGNATSPRLEISGGVTLTNAVSIAGRNNVSQGVESLSGANALLGNFTTGAGGGQYSIQVDGSSTLTLSNLIIQANGGRSVGLRGSGNGSVNGVISGGPANTNSLVKSGSGTWTLAGANTYNFPIIAANGTLALDYSVQNNSKISDAYGLYLAGGNVNLAGGSHLDVAGSNIVIGASSVTRSSGTSTLRLNSMTRIGGGTVDFGAASIADTDTLNVNGILGGHATVGGADWAINSTGAGDGAITAYSSYTDVAATGSTIADGAATNVRLNSAGGGGNIALGGATTTVNTLVQNTTTAATINTTAGILRLGATGGVLVPSAKQALTIGTAANAGTLTAGGADNTAGEIILINNSANDLAVNSTIADNGSGVVSLTKAGSTSATLAGNNTHTGTNYVSGGTLNISSSANLGTGTLVVNNGTLNVTTTTDLGAGRVTHLGPVAGYGSGTFSVASGQELTLSGVVASAPTIIAGSGLGVAGGLIKTGAGNLILAGANTYILGTTINGGTVTIVADNNLGNFDGPARNGSFTCYQPDNIVLNTGTLLASNTFTLSANRGIRLGAINSSGTGTVSVSDGNILTFGGQLSDNWNGAGSFAKAGNGTLVLSSGVNDYTGDTTVSGGILQINNSRAIPNGTGKGNVSVASGATLAINGVNVAINGLSGSGSVDNMSGTPVTFSVGNNNQSGSYSGSIGNTGGGQLALAKDGNNTLTLSGVASHTGSTLVRSGTLALTGAATIASTTNIAVSSGATLNVSGLAGGTLTLASGQVLSGVGSVVGNIDSGTGAIAPGASAGTLPITGNLTLGSGSSLNYELANVTTIGSGVNDLTTVSGNLTVAGPATLNLTYLNALPASSGKYTLISYVGTFSGNVNDISVPSGFTITNNTATKTIDILINHVPASLTWRGDGAGNVWDINATPNWNANTTTFFNGDTVNFDNSGSNTPAIFISGAPVASAINVNASQSYTFSGGDLAAGSLTKSGSGSLTLENTVLANGSTINNGTVQVGNAGTTGFLGGGEITNNAALVFNRGDGIGFGITVTNAISGSGSVTQIGNNDVGLNASNSYAGLTTVSSGRVFVMNGASLGSTSAGTVVSNGAELFITLNVDVGNEPLQVIGAGIGGIGGALHKGGAGVTTYGGAVSLLGDTMLNIDGAATLNLTNAAGVNGAAANANLQLAGAGAGNISGPILLGTGAVTNSGGIWTVASNNYAGNTIISGGRYRISSPKSLGTTPGAWTPDRVLLTGGGLEVTNDTAVALNDGKIGITLSALEGQLVVDAGATLTVSNEISGAGNLAKWFPGLLILNGSNSFTGEFYTDGNSTSANDGITRITRADALQNVLGIGMRNNNGGFSTLQFDGSSGNITLPQPMLISCRNNTNLCLQNIAGSNVLTGIISIQVGGADQWWQSEAGSTLVYGGDVNYVGALTGGRNYHFQGAGNHLVTGNINASPLGSPIAVTKDGTGTLTLAGANTYGTTTSITNGTLLLTGSISHTGAVAVVGGTLAGTGLIDAGAGVTVLAGGTLSPGASIGTLTLNNNNLTLAGTTRVELNKTANTNDLVTGINVVNYGGTLVISNVSGTLVIGNTFQIFSAAFTGGNFSSIVNQTGQGVGFTFNPSTGILTVVAGIPTSQPTLTNSVSGSTLSLTWPASHVGWILQSQTNAVNVGIGGTWTDVPGSAAVSSTNITINPANPTVFFRLRYP